MIQRKFSLSSRILSFKFAFDGFITMIKNEHNSRIHLLLSIIVITVGIFLKLTLIEWSLVIILIGLVFIAELFNSAIEKISDMIDHEINPEIRIIKDYTAAAVLISAIVSATVGAIIFMPKLIELVKTWY
ncbi:MAG: diacylglycerol kinase family protein [Methanococcaceae archaeon]